MKKFPCSLFLCALIVLVSVPLVSCGKKDSVDVVKGMTSVGLDSVNVDNVFFLLSKAYSVDFPDWNLDEKKGVKSVSEMISHEEGDLMKESRAFTFYSGDSISEESFLASGCIELSSEGSLLVYVSKNPSANYSMVGQAEEPLRLKIRDWKGREIQQKKNTFVYGDGLDPEGESFRINLMEQPTLETESMLREKFQKMNELLGI